VGVEHSIDVFGRQLEEYLLLYLSARSRHYEEVKRCSRVVYDPSDLTGHNNRYNIDYVISGSMDAETQDAISFFSSLLISKLRLRGLPVIVSIDERWARLKELHRVEQQLDIISKAISRGEEGKEAALMLLSQAIPCIMHLENRAAEKKNNCAISHGS
jgi:hypothetical protein